MLCESDSYAGQHVWGVGRMEVFVMLCRISYGGPDAYLRAVRLAKLTGLSIRLNVTSGWPGQSADRGELVLVIERAQIGDVIRRRPSIDLGNCTVGNSSRR
jgi:hypothetical protein